MNEEENNEIEEKESNWSNTKVSFRKGKLSAKKTYFKGISFNYSASADVTKSEEAFVWIMVLVGVILGLITGVKWGFPFGIFTVMFCVFLGMMIVGYKAFQREGSKEDQKYFGFAIALFVFVFVFIGIIFKIVF